MLKFLSDECDHHKKWEKFVLTLVCNNYKLSKANKQNIRIKMLKD